MEERPDAKIVLITIDGEDQNIETPWAFSVGRNLYRLDNVPFFAYGVSLGDVVEATPEPDDDRPYFRRVVKKSGNRTVRIVADDGSSPVDSRVLEELVRLGCGYEGANPKYFCVNVPPQANLDDVVEYLTRANQQWEHADPTYEELHGADEP